MGLRTSAEYEQSLRDDRRVFYEGERVRDVTVHPAIGPAVQHAGLEFRLAEDPRWKDLCTAEVDGEVASRFFVPPRSSADLRRRSELIDLLTREGGTLVTLVKEVGTDALFGLMALTAEMGEEGARYRENVMSFWREMAARDAAMALAQTDVKGDRSRGPKDQAHPDFYLRVVDRDAAGIRVRGAKAHTSVAVNSNEIIVLPTRALREGEEDYAVAFAVPADTPGVTMVASAFAAPRGVPEDRPISSTRRMVESTTIFDDVFVPWERVFLCGESAWAGPLALRFVEHHRFTAVSYKMPLCDAFVGAAVLLAEQNGILRAGHVRAKIVELVTWTETLRGLLVAAAEQCEPMPGGLVRPNSLLTNVAKYVFADGYHTAIRHVQDIAGGLVVTAPSWRDFQHGELGPVLEHYLAGANGTSAVDRLRAMNLVGDLTATEFGGYQQVLAVHAEGSLEAEKLQIFRAAPLDQCRAYARRLAGLD